MERNSWPPKLIILTAAVLAVMGLYLAIGGVWLLTLGGSFYYVVTGLIVLVTAVFLWRRQPAALWLYAAMLLATMIWAVANVGFDFWALVPRGDILVPVGIWLVLPFITRKLAPVGKTAAVALGATVVLALVVVGISLSGDSRAIVGTLPPVAAATTLFSDVEAGSD